MIWKIADAVVIFAALWIAILPTGFLTSFIFNELSDTILMIVLFLVWLSIFLLLVASWIAFRRMITDGSETRK